MKKRVKLTTMNAVLSCLVIAFVICICIWEYNRWGNEFYVWALFAFMMAWGFCCLFYAPLSIELFDNTLLIKTPLRIKKIPLSQVAKIKEYSPLRPIRRLCGSGGCFGYWGWFHDNVLGKYFAYYGNPSYTFAVKLKNGKQYVLGCEDSPEMVKAINAAMK